MANDLTQNPYVLDTAAAITVGTTPVSIMGFVFRATNATNSVVIHDNNGNLLLTLSAPANNECVVVMFPEPLIVRGLTINAITNGILHIFLSRQ